MKRASEAIYFGTVTHKRLRPRRHALSYRVFAVLFDCDRLDALDGRLSLFSRNRFNLVSLYDRDHGDGKGIRAYLDAVADKSVPEEKIDRFVMLCYPRILGYAFNPITVYFGLDGTSAVRLVIYEVNNTFGERMTYVIPAIEGKDGLIAQSCRKQLAVSPFNGSEGRYGFRVTALDNDITIGVALKVEGEALLKAHFRACRLPLTDRGLVSALGRTGWMTAKVIAGIHYEAAILWLKGLRVRSRPAAARRGHVFVDTPRKGL
jgi:DUF1365 family protein